MPQENLLLTMAARAASIPFRLFGRRPFVVPEKAVILQPGPLREVMVTTPLLAALSRAYPQVSFDWVVGDGSRAAVSGNPHVTKLVAAGFDTPDVASWRDLADLAQRLRRASYDTCFIPSSSSLLAWVAWRAQIPQRIGLQAGGRGFAHTIAVPAPVGERHRAAVYLALADAIGVDTGMTSRLPMAFYPSDANRTAVTQRLIDDLDWMGDRPLIVIHPGAGVTERGGRWPLERFVLLANHLLRAYGAQLLLVGDADAREAAQAVVGMLVTPVGDWSGRISPGELGALVELADLFVGTNEGMCYIAAAMACPLLTIVEASARGAWTPYSESGRVTVLGGTVAEGERPFVADHPVSVEEAIAAVEGLLRPLG